MNDDDWVERLRQLFTAFQEKITRTAEKSTRAQQEADESRRLSEEQKHKLEEADRGLQRQSGRIDAARAAASTKFAWTMAAAVVALALGALAVAAVFVGARHFVGGRPISLTPMAVLAGPPPAPLIPLPPPSSASADPDDDAGEEAGADCGLELLEPVDGQEIVVDGPLAIQWSDAGAASSYLLELHPPDGTASPWLIETEDTFRQIYMSNFPAEGEYGLVVSSMDAEGDPLCSVEFTFYKEAYLVAEAGDANAGGQPGALPNWPAAEGAQDGYVPVTPTWDPADDTVDYGGCPGCDANDDDVIVK